MNNKLSLLGGGVALTSLLLTGCVPNPTPTDPSVTLTFRLPDGAEKLKLAAVYFEPDQVKPDGVMKVLGTYGGYAGASTNERQMTLYGFDLKAVTGGKCNSAFSSGEASKMKNVTITPKDVTTCNIFFLAYADADNNNQPTLAEQKYLTHDIYSYASADFSYNMQTQGGNSTESGTRRKGWSLVRHNVLQPASTPGKYLVSMNSVPTADENIAIVLHEPSEFMTSMSVPSVPAGGAK